MSECELGIELPERVDNVSTRPRTSVARHKYCLSASPPASLRPCVRVGGVCIDGRIADYELNAMAAGTRHAKCRAGA